MPAPNHATLRSKGSRRNMNFAPIRILTSCALRPQELADLLCRRLDASRKSAQKVLGVLQVSLRRSSGSTVLQSLSA